MTFYAGISQKTAKFYNEGTYDMMRCEERGGHPVYMCYFELRKQSARGSDSIAADMMRHLHTRQHLGKALVICEHPVVVLSAARKQWLKIARSLQKQRASTLNADKILKYTHTITHMQHLHFTAKSPLEDPEADVYFTTLANLQAVPLHCFSIYLTVQLQPAQVAYLVAHLPAEALLVDYEQATPWETLGLLPKRTLEEHVTAQWQHMKQFLVSCNIDVQQLMDSNIHNVEAMDDALDTLLNTSHQFLQHATEFQRALELARPLRTTKAARQQYDTLSLLAHRVQALTSNAFTQQFLETYNEDDTFFLYDHIQALAVPTIQAIINRHEQANRHTLAQALQQYYMLAASQRR